MPMHNPPLESIVGRRYERAEVELRRLFRGVWIIAALLLFGLGGWAGTASIHGAIVATGTVVVEGHRRVVQSLDGGTIAAIHIKEGDLVEKDAVLITLDAREIDEALSGVDKEIGSQSKQITLIEDELKSLIDLQAKQLVARSRVSSMQREAARLAGEIARLSAEKSKLEARRQRTEVRAPAAGRVLNLLTHTVGGVMPSNATIAEIVPSNEALVVDVELLPGDIDQVRSGQHAQVRMTSLNQRTTPALDATVKEVSADLVLNESLNKRFFRVRVTLNEGSDAKLAGKTLLPGMPAEVLIETDRRSALSYFVKPLTDQIARAFRED